MARWNNFSMWRGRLPHWRADDVTYYITFRHRRALAEEETDLLFHWLMKAQRRKLDFLVLCVLPEKTEALFRVQPQGEIELSDVVEKAKRKAGSGIIKKTGERYLPFYSESFDRIVRDDEELEKLWSEIVQAPVTAGLTEEPDGWPSLFVESAP